MTAPFKGGQGRTMQVTLYFVKGEGGLRTQSHRKYYAGPFESADNAERAAIAMIQAGAESTSIEKVTE